MIIYNYSEQTGEFLAASTADADPKSPGQWLMPARATTKTPPSTGPNQAAVFSDGAWNLVPDHSGDIVYNTADKSPLTIVDLGEIPGGYTTAVPGEFDTWNGSAWVADTAAQIVAIQQQVKALANTKIVALAPEWKQRNMIARSLELERADRLNGSLTTDEQTEFDAMQTVWAAIKLIRAHSDTLEAAVDAVDADINTDINAGWPA